MGPLFVFGIIFLLDLELDSADKLWVFRCVQAVLLLLRVCSCFVMRGISWGLSRRKIRLTLSRLSISLQATLMVCWVLITFALGRWLARYALLGFNWVELILLVLGRRSWIWIYPFLMVQIPLKFMINGTILVLVLLISRFLVGASL